MGEVSLEKRRKAPTKIDNIFVVQILDQEHGTWQGRVTWADCNKTRYFRSALELFKLVNGALGTTEADVAFNMDEESDGIPDTDDKTEAEAI